MFGNATTVLCDNTSSIKLSINYFFITYISKDFLSDLINNGVKRLEHYDIHDNWLTSSQNI